MKIYKYIALDIAGIRRQGLRQAASSIDILGWLREQGFTPISVAAANEVKRQSLKFSRQKIKSADMAAVCWQLTTMVEGGLTIVHALETVSEDVDNAYLKHVTRQIMEKMNRGEILSNALSAFPNVFNHLSVAIILAGESSGDMAGALGTLANYFDDRDKLAKKMQSAIAYPVFVCSFIVLMIIFIMTFIIPRFQTIFKQTGAKLPGFTKAFMAVYEMVCHNIVYIAVFILLAIVGGVLAYSKTSRGHYLFGRIKLGLPMFGKLFKQAFLVVFCRTMGTLLAAGVPVLDVFNILGNMSGNDIMRSAIKQTMEYMIQGSNISTSMAATKFFPAMVINMIQVGEKSGSLPKILERTAKYYERKIDTTITTLMSMLEPVMIISVGAIVLMVVLALYLPVFSMSNITK